MDDPDEVDRLLDDLNDALDVPGADLHAMLDVLIDDLRAAVPSFTGLRITLTMNHNRVTISTIDPLGAHNAKTCLQLSLDKSPASVSNVTFYAAHIDALVDLAATGRREFDLDGQVVLDGHLAMVGGSGTPLGISGTGNAALVNTAIGILIDQGYPPEHAADELCRRAAQLPNLAAAARKVITSL